ncbi:hypothetical protein U1Q18_019477 [Sarracenia purpurea var. burkii]
MEKRLVVGGTSGEEGAQVKKQRRLGLKISPTQSRRFPSPSLTIVLDDFGADRQPRAPTEGHNREVFDEKSGVAQTVYEGIGIASVEIKSLY